MRMDRLWAFLTAMLPAIAALIVPMPSVDLAYHLRAGASILAGHGIPAIDTWTFTAAGTPWLDQQWGAQVLLAAVFGVVGWTGLALLRAALLALTFTLVRRAVRHASGGALSPTVAAILALIAFAVAAPALALRPQLFAILLFAATLLILAARTSRPDRVWLLPLFALAWASLHGTFPLLLVLVGLAFVEDLLARRDVGAVRLAMVGVASAAATLINPFGVDVWAYVANVASNPAIAGQVSEWRPPSPLEPTGTLFYASLAFAGVAALLLLAAGTRSRKRAVASAAPLLALAAFGTLGVATGRGLAWWALVAPVAIAALVAARRPLAPGGRDASIIAPSWVPEALRPPTPAGRPRRLNLLIAGGLLAAFVAVLPSWRATGPAGVPEGLLAHAPQALTAQLRGLVERGVLPEGARVWNPQLWGSWLEFAVPEVRVALDSRIELIPVDVWTDAATVSTATVSAASGDWRRTLAGHDIDALVVAPEQSALAAALEASGGRWTYRGSDGSIWLWGSLAPTILGSTSLDSAAGH